MNDTDYFFRFVQINTSPLRFDSSSPSRWCYESFDYAQDDENSPTHPFLSHLYHKAQIRPVESKYHAYDKRENDSMKNAKPSPVEKGDRGAVDKAYPGIKEK